MAGVWNDTLVTFTNFNLTLDIPWKLPRLVLDDSLNFAFPGYIRHDICWQLNTSPTLSSHHL